ncbi:MAG: nodulation protein NfeD [Spirochaetes bacterium]|nr:nodulation protein NfeD [Spirochaetota bacterium]
MKKDKKHLILIFMSVFLIASGMNVNAQQKTYSVIELKGSINPVVADFIVRSIETANTEKSNFILLTIDTPGGLVDSMREIIKAVFNSGIPVITYTYPKGAQAASAGGFIMLSGHLSAMAPGTEIGAMHPVSPMLNFNKDEKKSDGIMEMKVLNDILAFGRSIAQKRGKNIEWTENAIKMAHSSSYTEAKDLNVIDIIAEDIPDLLNQIHGLTIDVNGKAVQIDAQNLQPRYFEMKKNELFLNYLANPNIVFLLLIIAIAGIALEIKNPGMFVPGIAGGISLIFFLLAIKIVPINVIGLILLLLSVVLFILELSITSYGLLTIGGLVSFTLGALILFDSPLKGFGISYFTIITALLLITGFVFIVLRLIILAMKNAVATGKEGLIGQKGKAVSDFSNGTGKVYVHGEFWNALSDEPLLKDDDVIVSEVAGMQLKVKK